MILIYLYTLISEGQVSQVILAQGAISILFSEARCNWISTETDTSYVPIILKKSVEFTSAKNIQHKLDNPIGAIGTI